MTEGAKTKPRSEIGKLKRKLRDVLIDRASAKKLMEEWENELWFISRDLGEKKYKVKYRVKGYKNNEENEFDEIIEGVSLNHALYLLGIKFRRRGLELVLLDSKKIDMF